MGYIFTIDRQKEGYAFRLFPNNSRTVEIGRSEWFELERECRAALRLFQSQRLQFQTDESLCEMWEDGGLHYFRLYYDERRKQFFRRNGCGYYQKRGCQNGMRAVIGNLDAPLKM